MDNSITEAETMRACAEVVIRGVTTQGRTFRPSDWADRLAGLASEMGTDHRLNYGPFVQPVTRAGVRCVVISLSLEQASPPLFRFMLDFARDNDLEIVDGRQKARE